MAAVVAHEVKNPLTGIAGPSDHRQPAACGSRDAEGHQGDRVRIDALNDLMKDMLLFARPPQPRLTSVDQCRS
jgi:signal transduction histidine kinase